MTEFKVGECVRRIWAQGGTAPSFEPRMRGYVGHIDRFGSDEPVGYVIHYPILDKENPTVYRWETARFIPGDNLTHDWAVKGYDKPEDCIVVARYNWGIRYPDFENRPDPPDPLEDFVNKFVRNQVVRPADILKKEETSMAIPTNALVPVKIIYNYPATIVFWKDGTKTVVQCSENDLFDEQAGFKAALAKKLYGHNHFIQKMVDGRKVYDKKHKVPDKRLRQRKPKVAKNAKPVTKNRSV